MAGEIEKLQAAAEKLVAEAQTNAAVAARLEKNAAQEISSAAGCPVPAGIQVSCMREGDKIALKVDFNDGELDDKVLDKVAGGKESGQKQRQRTGNNTTYLGPGASRGTTWGSYPFGRR